MKHTYRRHPEHKHQKVASSFALETPQAGIRPKTVNPKFCSSGSYRCPGHYGHSSAKLIERSPRLLRHTDGPKLRTLLSCTLLTGDETNLT